MTKHTPGFEPPYDRDEQYLDECERVWPAAIMVGCVIGAVVVIAIAAIVGF